MLVVGKGYKVYNAEMIDFDAFAGRDRLEQVPAFGRVFRMGSVDALVASDPEKIRELLSQAGGVNEAREYLSYIHGLNNTYCNG